MNGMRRRSPLFFMETYFKREIVLFFHIVILLFALSITLNLQTIRSFAISGDNFALLLDSASFFEVSPTDWFVHGFRYYFVVYPEAFQDAHYFVRPMQNILVYLISLFAESPNSAIFLIPYLATYHLEKG